MLLVGLTGGIGSGKSLVGRLLAEHGAIVIDADDLAREALEPGTPGERQALDRFGPEIAAGGGGIDREALAAIVFDDESARRDLEAIVHPEVRRLLAERIATVSDPDAVVVFEAPLLIETGMAAGFDELVVVLAPEETRLRRLREVRGIRREDAQARLRAQTDDAARRAAATLIIENPTDDLETLRTRVGEVWADLARRVGR